MVNKIYFKRSACCTVLCVPVSAVKAARRLWLRWRRTRQQVDQSSAPLIRKGHQLLAISGKRVRGHAERPRQSFSVAHSSLNGFAGVILVFGWLFLLSWRLELAVGITEEELSLYSPNKLILESFILKKEPLFWEHFNKLDPVSASKEPYGTKVKLRWCLVWWRASTSPTAPRVTRR